MTNLDWRKGNFANGLLTSTPFPVAKAGKVSLTVTGEGTADVTVALGSLDESQRANWRQVFKPIENFIVVEDKDLTWDDPAAIIWAGFINKLGSDVGKEQVKIQAVELMEYFKMRLVIEKWGEVLNPNETIEFTAGTWAGVINNIIRRCFSTDGIPLNSPAPPQILAPLTQASGTAVSKVVRVTDAKTYYDVLEEVKMSDSGNGQEFLLKPRFATAARNRVVWELILGDPHIRGTFTDIDLPLEEASGARFSSYGSTIDSRANFSKIYIQSRRGDEATSSGADLKPAYIQSSQAPILVEQFFNPNVELTPAQRDEQLSARIALGNQDQYVVSFSVEENWNPSLWLNRLGRMLNITGIPTTISEGHDARLRLMGISFEVGKGTCAIDVIQPAVAYPKLPKPGLLASNPYSSQYNSSLNTNSGGSGGGGGSQPWNPGDEDGGDGGPTIDWGSGGSNPGDIPPAWNDPFASEWAIDQITPNTIISGIARVCTNEGNTVFGVSSASQSIDYGSNGGMNYSGPHEFPITTNIFGADVYSGYLMNGLTTDMAKRSSIGLSQTVLTALWGLGAEYGIGRPTSVWGGTPTSPLVYEAYCRNTRLSVGDIFSVAGNIFVAIELEVTWQWKTNPTQTNWSTNGPSQVQQAAIVFMKAEYASYDSVGAFYVDMDSGLSLDRPTAGRSHCVRVGSWVVLSASGSVAAAPQISSSNFISGGEGFGTWWNFPIAPAGGQATSMAVAKNKTGEGQALFLSVVTTRNIPPRVFSFDITAPPIPKPDSSWETVDTSVITAGSAGSSLPRILTMTPHQGNSFGINTENTLGVEVGRVMILNTEGKIVPIPPGWNDIMGTFYNKPVSYGDFVYIFNGNGSTLSMTSFRLKKVA